MTSVIFSSNQLIMSEISDLIEDTFQKSAIELMSSSKVGGVPGCARKLLNTTANHHMNYGKKGKIVHKHRQIML